MGNQKKNKELVSRLLIRGSDVRNIYNVVRISTACILRLLLSLCSCRTKTSTFFLLSSTSVDALYSFVQSKKKKVWILYAYCSQRDEILALTMSKRNKKTVRDLFKRLKDTQVNFECIDPWKAFKEVFSTENHLVGKRFTKAIEGVNTSLRMLTRD